MPDLIVGIVTGVAVGGVVLGTERRISGRARANEVMRAQAQVVERARSLLQHEIEFRSDSGPTLHPKMSQLARLQELVREVPPGEPLVRISAYHWAARLVATLDELESLADALDQRIADYHNRAGIAAWLGHRIHANIRELARLGPQPDRVWAWSWESGHDDTYTPQVEADAELRDLIDRYLQQRWLLLAYREAFVDVDFTVRADSWALTIAAYVPSPYNFPKRWWREYKRRRAIEQSWRQADARASDRVTAIDPMAY